MRNKLKKGLSKATILGVRFNSSNKHQLLSRLEKTLSYQAKSDLTTIVTPNPEQVVLAQTNDRFRSILNSSTFSLPDGTGIVLASKFLTLASKESPITRGVLTRIAGIDFMLDLCQIAAKKKLNIFLLGGQRDVASLAAKNLKTRFPGINVASFSGAPEISKETDKQHQEAIENIKEFKTDVLFVAFGAPNQEIWIDKNKKQLEKLGVKIAMAVGGSLDIIGGRLSRAPKLVQAIGLEWLYRLGQEPHRLKRQLKLLTFIKLILFAKS